MKRAGNTHRHQYECMCSSPIPIDAIRQHGLRKSSSYSELDSSIKSRRKDQSDEGLRVGWAEMPSSLRSSTVRSKGFVRALEFTVDPQQSHEKVGGKRARSLVDALFSSPIFIREYSRRKIEDRIQRGGPCWVRKEGWQGWSQDFAISWWNNNDLAKRVGKSTDLLFFRSNRIFPNLFLRTSHRKRLRNNSLHLLYLISISNPGEKINPWGLSVSWAERLYSLREVLVCSKGFARNHHILLTPSGLAKRAGERRSVLLRFQRFFPNLHPRISRRKIEDRAELESPSWAW